MDLVTISSMRIRKLKSKRRLDEERVISLNDFMVINNLDNEKVFSNPGVYGHIISVRKRHVGLQIVTKEPQNKTGGLDFLVTH